MYSIGRPALTIAALSTVPLVSLATPTLTYIVEEMPFAKTTAAGQLVAKITPVISNAEGYELKLCTRGTNFSISHRANSRVFYHGSSAEIGDWGLQNHTSASESVNTCVLNPVPGANDPWYIYKLDATATDPSVAEFSLAYAFTLYYKKTSE